MTTPVVHVHRALSSCFHPGIIATGSPFGDGDCSSGHEKKPGDPDAQPSTYLGHSGGEPPAWPLRDDDDDDVDDALEKPPQQQPEPPTAHRMDGGLEAWLQVLGSWLLFINTWGLTNSYGTFQTYYSSDASPIPSYASSSLSWIGSMQSFLTMFMGSLAGPLVDAGYMRAALVAGTCLEVVGLLATSFSTQLWQLFLFQGLTVGLGSGMLSTASLTIIPMYFKEMKMTASGIAASGSAVAGIALPIMLRNLFPAIGFAWSVRVYALIVFTLLSTACLLIKPRATAQKASGPIFRPAIFKDKVYTCWVLAYMFMVASAYVPLFYIGDYALSIGVDPNMATYVLSIMNTASLMGRLPPSIMADKIGPINVLVPSALATLTIAYCFQGVENTAGIITIGVFYCLMTSGMVSLPPMTITQLSSNPAEYGTRIGMGYTVASIGALVGSPLAGLTLTDPRAERNDFPTLADARAAYRGVWLVAGTNMAVSCALMVLVRYWVGGRRWKIKV